MDDIKYKCSKCGFESPHIYKWTDFMRAMCPVQYLINDRWICFNCINNEAGKEATIRVYNALQNPVVCAECEGTPMCPCSKAASDAMRKNIGLRAKMDKGEIDDFNSLWGSAGPDCITVRLEAA